MADLLKFFEEKVLGKQVRVDLNDNRIFYGELECIDNERNLLLKDALEEIPIEYVSPLNAKLEKFIANSFPGDPYVNTENVPADKKEYFEKEFSKNKFRVGGVVIMGKDIKKLMLQKENPNKPHE